eukprot:362876-Chlamydomonas_euryale.AAC.3
MSHTCGQGIKCLREVRMMLQSTAKPDKAPNGRGTFLRPQRLGNRFLALSTSAHIPATTEPTPRHLPSRRLWVGYTVLVGSRPEIPKALRKLREQAG